MEAMHGRGNQQRILRRTIRQWAHDARIRFCVSVGIARTGDAL